MKGFVDRFWKASRGSRLVVLWTLVVGIIALLYVMDASRGVALAYQNASDYVVVEADKVATYDAVQVRDQIYTDMVGIPTPDYLGMLIRFKALQFFPYAEMHLEGGAEYQIDFMSGEACLGGMAVSTHDIEQAVLKVPEDACSKGYDCIRIIPLSGRSFGLAYLGLLERYEDNVVLQAVEESGIIRAELPDGIREPCSVPGIQAYFYDQEPDLFEIEVVNIHDRPIELISIEDDTRVLASFADDTVLEPVEGLAYVAFQFADMAEYQHSDLGSIRVRYRIEGCSESYVVPLVPFQRLDEELFAQTQVRTTDNLEEFDSIEVRDGMVMLAEADVTLDHPLFVPAGYVVKLDSGQSIDLVNGAYIVSRSPVRAMGTQTDAILIHSSDGTGRGLFVCQAPEESVLCNVTVDGQDTPMSGAWQLTGAVTFYESPVRLEGCVIRNNTCEDALNIVRSEFSVCNTVICDTFADALDSDFSRGELVSCSFYNTGNDALDVSGSIVTVDDVDFHEIGDKALSAGERSEVTVNDISVAGAVIGLASKDSSRVTGHDISIRDVQIGYTLYRKKPEYGGGFISVDEAELLGDIGLAYLIEPGSSLWIDDTYIEPKSASKESLLIEAMIAGESIQ